MYVQFLGKWEVGCTEINFSLRKTVFWSTKSVQRRIPAGEERRITTFVTLGVQVPEPPPPRIRSCPCTVRRILQFDWPAHDDGLEEVGRLAASLVDDERDLILDHTFVRLLDEVVLVTKQHPHDGHVESALL